MRQTAQMHLSLNVIAAALSALSWLSASSLPSPSPAPSTMAVPSLAWHEVSRVSHDPRAFTQGLVIDDRGRMFESTGIRGESSLRELDREDGDVIRSKSLAASLFGEGLALVDDTLVQLTWTAGQAWQWHADTFAFEGLWAYDGQGWGLCYDGEHLVMSDGSDRLTFRDPDTFEVRGVVSVTLDGRPLADLNELECVDSVVWANVWHRDEVVRIDPRDGRVTGRLDLSGLLQPNPADEDPEAVLNGLAWDAASETMWVTGKRWPEMVELHVAETSGPGS
jgi:glutamine cyclotransferase